MSWFSKLKSMCGFDSMQKNEPIDYSTMKVAELKAMAKERGIKGYYNLRRAELLDILDSN